MTASTYETAGGIRVHRTVDEIPVADAIEPVIHALDSHRGVLLASSYEYPGRYTRWDMGFVNPPLVLTARERRFRVDALNARASVLLPSIAAAWRALEAVERLDATASSLEGAVRAPGRPQRAAPTNYDRNFRLRHGQPAKRLQGPRESRGQMRDHPRSQKNPSGGQTGGAGGWSF